MRGVDRMRLPRLLRGAKFARSKGIRKSSSQTCEARHTNGVGCVRGQARFGGAAGAQPGIHHFGEAIHHEVREARSSAFRNGPRDHAWRWSEHAGRRYEPVSSLVILARLRHARSRRAEALARPSIRHLPSLASQCGTHCRSPWYVVTGGVAAWCDRYGF